jgi:hypothetical protein
MNQVQSTTPPTLSSDEFQSFWINEFALSKSQLTKLSKLNPKGTYKLNGKVVGLEGADLKTIID